MTYRTNVSPTFLPVRKQGSQIELTYLDGRVVTYSGPFNSSLDTIEANRSVEVHVLIVDHDFTEGMMVYINDYDTIDDILESSGVGRIILADESVESLYPGVQVSRDGERIRVNASDAPSDIWVYAFIESQLTENAYRLSAPSDIRTADDSEHGNRKGS